MKTRQRQNLTRAIRQSLPDLSEKGRLLAARPRGRILRGVYLEDSSDPDRVYVWAFVQPLYALASTISFNLGKRLGGPSKTWSVNEPQMAAAAVLNEGLPFFGPITSPAALATWTFVQGNRDPYAMEARACSLIAAGRFASGVSALREVAGSLAEGAPWMMELKERLTRLVEVTEKAPTRAQELLAKWEAETAIALGVQDLP